MGLKRRIEDLIQDIGTDILAIQMVGLIMAVIVDGECYINIGTNALVIQNAGLIMAMIVDAGMLCKSSRQEDPYSSIYSLEG